MNFCTSLLCLCSFIFFQSKTYGPEYIKEFNSDITINSDGSLDVTETIVYVNKNLPNKHGIFRDFPTAYKGPYGTNYTVRFQVKNVLRNGVPEFYTVETIRGGKRISTGDDTVIPPGKSTYTITYHTHRQLGFLPEYDMLYWNVTGNGWPWVIEKATATVHVPKDIPTASIRAHAFTGSMGEPGGAYRSQIHDDNSVTFETTQSLWIKQGLTIQVSWPKGFIREPTTMEEFRDTLYDNAGIIIVLLSLLFSILWYLVWWRIMRRKEARLGGPIIPLFEPPANMSPGEVRYILKMNYDAKQFAAEAVDMAIKGLIIIDYKKVWWSDTYSLIKQRNLSSRDSALHKDLAKLLFSQKNTLELSQKNQTVLKKAGKCIENTFEARDDSLFIKNGLLTAFPLISTITLFFIAVMFNYEILEWLGFIFIIVIGMHILGYQLIKSYTPDGCRIKHQILGFKMFLETTESDRMELIGTPPTQTPELYEKYLPYAIALGVEKQWSRKFAHVFYNLEKKGSPYTPIWYHGGDFKTFNAQSFSSTLSSSLQSAANSSGAGGFGKGGSGGGRGGGGGGSR